MFVCSLKFVIIVDYVSAYICICICMKLYNSSSRDSCLSSCTHYENDLLSNPAEREVEISIPYIFISPVALDSKIQQLQWGKTSTND